jgi:hypothetical protein
VVKKNARYTIADSLHWNECKFICSPCIVFYFCFYYLPYSFSKTTQRISTAQSEYAKSRQGNNSVFLTKTMSSQPEGGHPIKWNKFSEFIISRVRGEWDKGMPICTEELFILIQCYVISSEDDDAIKLFADG